MQQKADHSSAPEWKVQVPSPFLNLHNKIPADLLPVDRCNCSDECLPKVPENISECGFLTNPDEAALLQSEEYQEKVANAVADGIGTYLEEQEVPEKN